MTAYEYKVVPAPAKGERARGIKGTEARFSHSLERVMNDMAADGWEYQRAETLPSDERSGLASTVTVWRNVLVFRRGKAGDVAAYQPRKLDAPKPYVLTTPLAEAVHDQQTATGTSDPDQPLAHPMNTLVALPVASTAPPETPRLGETPEVARTARVAATDNGVEETQDLHQMSSILRDRAARLIAAEQPGRS
ncbi:DUF4177 domain-containing protein [Puniceibacterium sp. IMCC21224]|uniref:DUF4177 domain-containing protein n=1 Tax=Puniceibacterium sp. IMCC21224 TaxID=1618204 RepID=UPI00064DC973|nr:DUF4177 domain-containing protein [Puniceibacterium sp. IMCC21224]KMK67865.1 hypothetical protein IMCC21224_112742 [Puniceibacterium sp. IMCC21224]